MRYLEVALVISTAANVFSEEFIQVQTSCRYWDKLTLDSNRGSGELHCILDQNKLPGIVYTEWIPVPSGYCPIYNRYAKVIDCIPCNGSIGDCPTKLVKSYQAVIYTGCFQMPVVKTCVKKDTSTLAEKTLTVEMGIYMLILVVFLLTTPALIGIWIWINRFRNPSQFKTMQDTITASGRRSSEQIKRYSYLMNRNGSHLESNGSEFSPLSGENEEGFKI